jgi:hypothetical protein
VFFLGGQLEGSGSADVPADRPAAAQPPAGPATGGFQMKP